MNLIHRSKYYTLYQSVKDRCFYVDFGQKTVRMSLCQLLSLREKTRRISIESHFDGDLNRHGFEVLLLCNKEHLFILNTLEILDLRRFVDQTFVSLGLAAKAESINV
ncbi:MULTISPECIES: hypothetical protein [Flavobacteriaceae]|uniref:hypothetical protein n=1 Tax=Flavobacteriaceae TaxID=49546 RepID=UPI00149190DE|nr:MULTISPECIES: hypothetical protein [Allomuricauda]MDC6365462.1 hypothetical protein [Muricauda sp. AC10]